MFKAGEFYLEFMRTGTVTFEENGTPTVLETRSESVYSFYEAATPHEMQTKLKPVTHTDLTVDTRYARLFRAPAGSFDSEGRLEAPRFLTVGFYESDSLDFRNFVNIDSLHGNVSKVCPGLPAEVKAFFGEPAQD